MKTRIERCLRGWRLGLCLAGLVVAGVLAARLTLRAEEPGEFTWPFHIGAQSPEPQPFSFPAALAAAEAETGMDLRIVGPGGAWGEVASQGCPYLVPLGFFGGAEPPPQIPLAVWCVLSMGGYAQVTTSQQTPGWFAGTMGGFAVYIPAGPVLVQWGSQQAPDPALSAGLAACFAGGGGFLGNAYAHVSSPQVPGQPLVDNAVSSWKIEGLVRYVPTAPPNQPPTARASADKTVVLVGQPVQFRGDESTDPENQGLGYLWDFGDGTISTDPNPTHIYTEPKEYTVRLTVHDPQSAEDTAELTILVLRIDRLSIEPAAVILFSGQTQQFKVTGTWYGPDNQPDTTDDVVADVTSLVFWRVEPREAGGQVPGTVTGAGLFTAGEPAGDERRLRGYVYGYVEGGPETRAEVDVWMPLMPGGYVDIDVDSNNNGVVEPDSDAEDDIELRVPKIIWSNNDDDNLNGVLDCDEFPVTGEKSLAELRLRIKRKGSLGGLTATLCAAGGEGRVRLWTTSNKAAEVTMPHTWPASQMPTTLWIEGIKHGDVQLALQVKDNSPVLKEDRVKLRVWELPAIADFIMDDDTVTFYPPGYPPQTVHLLGTFRMIMYHDFQQPGKAGFWLTQTNITATPPIAGQQLLVGLDKMAALSFGTFDKYSGAMMAQWYFNVGFVANGITQQVSLGIPLSGTLKITPEGKLKLNASGAGVLPAGFPLFPAGTTYVYNPAGGGCEGPKKPEKPDDPKDESAQAVAEVGEAVIDNLMETIKPEDPAYKALKLVRTVFEKVETLGKLSKMSHEDMAVIIDSLAKVFRAIPSENAAQQEALVFLTEVNERSGANIDQQYIARAAMLMGTAVMKKFAGKTAEAHAMADACAVVSEAFRKKAQEK